MLPNLKNLKKGIALMALFQLGVLSAHAQVDTVYSNNQKIACTVKEITPDAVKYIFPGEEVVNSVYKNTVQKIVFKNGRVQTFAESTSYKPVTKVMDFENVTMTSLEGEVKGLYKLSDVSSKAKGTTVYSSQERVKDRAYRKLKIQAAMFGANIILLTNQRTEGNKYGGYYQSGSPTETNLTGIAYSNQVPDNEAFKKLIGDKKDFITYTRFELDASDADVQVEASDKAFTISNISNENGVTMIEGNLKGEKNVFKFQLASMNDSSFSIAYKYKGSAYNYLIRL
ncbi:hypothetical protein ACFS5N_10345 [Mucilaginibacter ximonensis]|uniref:Tissue inhibitor of metalloproteinase n=1 Tax=Mucilaginibacter ximonensis TaxID=538021 RepID=A0ABW5YC16_9SPHI